MDLISGFFKNPLSFQIFWTCGSTTTKHSWVRAKWGPLSSSGREGGAEAEEEGEEEEGSEPAHHSATFRHIPPTWDNTLRREWQCEFWGRSVRSGHPEESAQTDSDI